jgi:hypothetical protein
MTLEGEALSLTIDLTWLDYKSTCNLNLTKDSDALLVKALCDLFFAL